MIEITLIELIGRVIPEELLFMWGCYILSNTKFNYKRLFLSSIILAVFVYLIRLLPIHFGINTLLNIILFTFLNIKVNRINTIKSIQVTLYSMALGFACEFINVAIIKYIFRADLDYVFSSPILKIIYGTPFFVIFTMFIILTATLSKKLRTNTKETKYISNTYK